MAHGFNEFFPPDFEFVGGVKNKDWNAYHTMIVIDELARTGSTGVGWNLTGGGHPLFPFLLSLFRLSQEGRFLIPGDPGMLDPPQSLPVMLLFSTLTSRSLHWPAACHEVWVSQAEGGGCPAMSPRREA